MSEHPSHDDIPLLEVDETIPPRPEEEVADVARSEPQTGSVPIVAEPTSGSDTPMAVSGT